MFPVVTWKEQAILPNRFPSNYINNNNNNNNDNNNNNNNSLYFHTR